MMSEHDEDWLREVATGVADGTHVIDDDPPTEAIPVGVPIQAPFVNQVHAEDLELTGQRIDTVILDGDDERRTDQPQTVGAGEGGLESSKKRKHSEAGEGGRKSSKKDKSKSSSHRTSSSKKHRSHKHLSLEIDEEFTKRTYEEYVRDPLSAAVHTVLHVRDLMQTERDKNEQLLQEARKQRDESLTELSKLKAELQTATISLTTLRADLKVLTKQRDDLAAEKTAEETKVAELSTQVANLVAKEKTLYSEVGRLTKRVTDLEKQLKLENAEDSGSGQGKIAQLEKELRQAKLAAAASDEKAKKTAQLALQMKERGFQLAMDQVKVVNPGMIPFMGTVFFHAHSVEDGKIVKVDKASKHKSVVYPSTDPS